MSRDARATTAASAAATTAASAAAAAAVLVALALLGGCDAGAGALTFTTFGESFIEQQIPAARGPDGEGFVDGYSVRYDKFLLALSNLRVTDAAGRVGAALPTQRIFDLARPGPHEVAIFEDVDARRFDDVAVDALPADGAALNGNANEADVALMNDRGYVAYVEGHASDGATRYRFRWGFKRATRYFACADADGNLGVVVPSGGSRTVQLTIHGDHLFFDDLTAADAKLRFAALAGADRDGDHEVTLEELAAVDLTTLPLERYGTGADGTIHNLAQFVTAQTRSLVHFQGEGDCRIR